MKKILVLHKKNPQGVIGEFNSIEDAQVHIIGLAQEDEDVSIFDYSIKEVEYEDVSTTIQSYESARDRLGRVAIKVIPEVREHHAKALDALNKLFTIAEAWNKADNFVPDYDDTTQCKWFPWFQKRGNAGFVCTSAAHTVLYSSAYFGSRLCFKTDERAMQFGRQFIDLWNDFLLFR